MPDWLMCWGNSSGWTLTAPATGTDTYYFALNGQALTTASEAFTQLKATRTFGLGQLYVRIRQNSLSTAVVTVRSRKNGANGNQVVAISSASGVGAFTDSGGTSGDALASGTSDLFNGSITMTSGSGTVVITAMSMILGHASLNVPLIAAAKEDGLTVQPTSSNYTPIWTAFRTPSVAAAAQAQLPSPASFPVSDWRWYVSSNPTTTAGATINVVQGTSTQGVDVALTTAGAANSTGEQVVATEVIFPSGTTASAFGWRMVNPGAAGSSYTITLFQVQSSGSYQLGLAGAVSISSGAAGSTTFQPIAGLPTSANSSESDVQVTMRYNANANTMLFNTQANNGGIQAALRRNGVDVISIATTTGQTGQFMETATSAAFTASDLVNWRVSVPGGAPVGAGTLHALSIKLDPGSTDTIRGRMLLGVGQ